MEEVQVLQITYLALGMQQAKVGQWQIASLKLLMKK